MKQLPKFSHSYWDTVEEAEKVDERTARIPRSGIDRPQDDDGEGWCLLRITPPGQKTVGELIHIGDLVRSNYSMNKGKPDGRVTSVSEHYCYGLSEWGIIYVPLDAPKLMNGEARDHYNRYINELVAQDGRILKLFVANTDEVFVMGAKGQMGLFRYG